MIGNLLF